MDPIRNNRPVPDRRKIENILREPLTRARFALNSRLRAAEDAENPDPFTIQDLQQFALAIPNQNDTLRRETLNMMEAVQTGRAPQPPNVDTPETQLLWGAGLAYLMLNPDAKQLWQTPPAEDAPLHETPLWKQITGTRRVVEELRTNGHHIEEALRSRSTKYGWGAPGSGLTFDRKKNKINIDLMQGLTVGFEHARADVYREIGHSLLSLTYPKKMQDVYRQMQPLLKKSQQAQAKKGQPLKPEDYKKLRMLSAEWQLRHMLFSAAEENAANRFASNMGQKLMQDYSVSINNTAVTFRGMGLARLPTPEGASEDLRRYLNLVNAVQLSFFANNNLFDDTEQGWRMVGVKTDMVRKSATRAAATPDKGGVNHPDFKELRELCGGPNGLENLQPKPHEMLYRFFGNRLTNADQERNAVIEKIWRLYAEDLIQNILEQVNDQVDQQLEEQKQQAQEQQQDGQDQDGEGQDQDGEGQDQDGEGQPGQPGKGKPQKGKKQKGRGRPQGDISDPDDFDSDDGDQQGEPSDEQNDQDGQGDGDDMDGEDADNDNNQGKPEGDLGAEGDDTVPVENAGDMPAPDEGFEKPADEMLPDGAEADQDGEDADGQTADELDQQLADMDEQDGEDADGQDADSEGDDADAQAKAKSKKASKQAGHDKGESLGDLAKKDWTKYNERIAELAGPITRVRKLFKDVQERQLQRKRAVSRSLDILPENGEIKDRFNDEAHLNLTIKRKTGQVEENDLKRFHKDEVKMTPVELDVVIMIDGSGSMGSSYGSGTSPLDSALQASAILYEAAAGKDMSMNVYVGMWGNNRPPILIKPGDDRAKIGQAMEAARKGLHSGTDMAPAVKKVAETIGDARGKSGTMSGFTHVLIVSDGDIFDADKSKDAIQTMFDHSSMVTFDAAIITGSKNSNMEKLAKSVKGRKPWQEMGVAVGDNPEEIPFAIVGLVLDKVRKCGSFTAVPKSKKRRDMKKAHNKMDPKK